MNNFEDYLLNTNTMHFGNVVKENLYDNISKNITLSKGLYCYKKKSL